MKDFNELIQQHFGPLNSQDLSVIQSYFREEQLGKNEIFTNSDEICNKLSIVKSGILRVFALSEDGKEITQWLSTKDFFITDVMGFFLNQPNRWTIQAFTEVELLSISKADYQKLCQEFPKWLELKNSLLSNVFQ